MLAKTTAVAVLLVVLIVEVCCQPVAKVEGRAAHKKKSVVLDQLIPYITSGFLNAIISTIINWFYPLKVEAGHPGKFELAELFANYFYKSRVTPPPYYGRRRRSATLSPEELFRM